jgi:hypothetical protein
VSYETYLPGEQFLHHALLDLAGFGDLRLQRCDPFVHVSEDGGDSPLLGLSGWDGKRTLPEYIIQKVRLAYPIVKPKEVQITV